MDQVLETNVDRFLEELRKRFLKGEIYSIEINMNSFEYDNLIELADKINIGLCVSASNHFFNKNI